MANVEITIIGIKIDVPENTEDVSNVFKFWFAILFNWKLPPKYLNKSKYEKILYLSQFAPCEINVINKFKM